jgi:DNA-directed RNA polymerase specialized sigma24 family protein
MRPSLVSVNDISINLEREDGVRKDAKFTVKGGRYLAMNNFERAEIAASNQDPIGMLEELYRAHALDGLARVLHSKWPDIPTDELNFIIATAVDVLYRNVKAGEKILNIGAYLYKTSNLKAHQYNATMRREQSVVKDLKYRSTGDLDPQTVVEEAPEADGEDENYESKRARACSIAKSLLPQLGQKNIQDVMRVIIEAVEAGREDISNVEIAEILGLSNVTIRQLRKRGFERLTERARSAGILQRGIEFVGFEDTVHERVI